MSSLPRSPNQASPSPPRNPYIAGRALSSARGFAGRDDVFRVVQAELEQPDRNAIVLFGQRRIGKTSILLNLRAHLPTPPFVTVYFDLMDRARKSLVDVLYEIAQSIASELGLPIPARDDLGNDGVAFRRTFLPSVYTALGHAQRLVLLLDEFDVLDVRQEEQLPDTSAARAFFPYLRELMMNESQLGFVFVVGRKAGEMSTNFKAAFKAARYYRISMLDETAARALVLTAQGDGTLNFSPDAAARILALTACHPYFTQLLCQLVFERAYQSTDGVVSSGASSGAPTIQVQDVDAVIAKALEAGENVFEWIWDGLPPAERVIFSAVATGTDEHSVVTEERLLSILQDSGVRILVRELELAPRTLIEWEMLKQAAGGSADGYQFVVELMRRWVVARKPLARVKDELDRINPLADMLYQVATGFYRTGNVDNAITQLQQALSVNPNHLKAHLLLGELYKTQNRLDDMLREYGEAYRIDEDASRVAYEGALILRGEDYANHQQDDEQVRLYTHALEVAPNSRVVRERLATVTATRQQREIARYTQQAQSAVEREDWDDAASAYTLLVKLEPAQARWHEALERSTRERDLAHRYAEGVSATLQRNWSVAQQAYGDVVAQRPGYKNARAQLETATREVEQARVAALTAGQTVPDSRRRFLVDWVLATGAGYLLGGLITALLFVPSSHPRTGPGDTGFVMLFVLGPALASLFQVQVLEGRLPNPLLWLGTIAGVVGSAVLASLVRSGGVYVGLLAFVLLPAGAQWLVLRRRVPHAGWWVPAYALSWGAGFGLLLLIAAVLTASSSALRMQTHTGWLLGLCMMSVVLGLVYALGSGLAMARLLTPGRLLIPSLRPRRLVPGLACGGAVLVIAISALALNRPPDGLIRRLDKLAESVAFSPDGATLASSARGIILWQVSDGTVIRTIGNLETGGYSADVVFTPDGSSVVFGDEKDIRVARVADGSTLTVMHGHTDTVHGLTISPDGQHLLSSSSDGTMRLWNVQSGAQERQYEGFNIATSSSVFSPDGKTFATGTKYQGQYLVGEWNVDTGQPVTNTKIYGDVVYSPDGTVLITANWDGVTVYRRKDHIAVNHLSINAYNSPLAISRDGTWLAGATGETVWLLRMNSNYNLTRVRDYDISGSSAHQLAFSPDGHTLVTVSNDNVVEWWQVGPEVAPQQVQPQQQQLAAPTALPATLSLSTVLTGSTSAVYRVAYSPDGRLLAEGGNDEAIRIWDVSATPTQTLATLHGHQSAVNSLAFNPDSTVLASGSNDHTILLWDMSNPVAPVTLTQPLVGHTGRVAGLVFAPDGALLASAGYDGKVILWDMSNVRQPRLLKELNGHSDRVSSVAFSPDGKTLASGSFDRTILLWDVSNPTAAAAIGKPMSGHINWVTTVAFSPDGRTLASGSNDDSIILWDVSNRAAPTKLGQPLKGHTDTVQGVAFSPNGKRLISVSSDGRMVLWNVSDPASAQRMNAVVVSKKDVWGVAICPAGTQVATADEDNTVKLWDVTVAK
jgi:WD40 repeat protein/tetratricopeptide (TPR) repeat protein